MCSPELTRGICQICFGTLAPETMHVDRDGSKWDVHKGVCAMHAGEAPAIHAAKYSWYIQRLHKASSEEVRRSIIRAFYKWIDEVADENHYCHDGP